MDPLTHMLAGAAAADAAGTGGRQPARLLPFAMILAALPDIDVLPAFLAAFPRSPFSREGLFDPEVMRAMHRGYTHSLPILAGAGLLLAWAGWRLAGRNGGYRTWARSCLAALASHLILDLANGPVRLFLPFSDGWHGLGQMGEADPVIAGLLLACFLANHPPRFARPSRLGTLRLVEQCGSWLHCRAGRFLSVRDAGRATCLALALYAAVRIAWNR